MITLYPVMRDPTTLQNLITIGHTRLIMYRIE